VKRIIRKVLLEAELLDLNQIKQAQGTVVEAFLTKERICFYDLVQNGTLKIGDYMLAGKHHGKIKAMHDERGNIVTVAGPSTRFQYLS
jgi:translation initiation factor IF-2